MMRGAEMLFAALFAVTFLGRRLNRLHAAGLAACVAGKVGKVAFTQYFAGSPANLATTALSDPEMSAEDLHTLIIKGFVPLPPNADDFRADLRIFPCFSEPFTKP